MNKYGIFIVILIIIYIFITIYRNQVYSKDISKIDIFFYISCICIIIYYIMYQNKESLDFNTSIHIKGVSDLSSIDTLPSDYINYNDKANKLIDFIFKNKEISSIKKIFSKYLIVLDRYKIKDFAKQNNIPYIPVLKKYNVDNISDLNLNDFPYGEFRLFESSHGERVLNIYNKEGQRYIGAIDLSLDARIFENNWVNVKEKLIEWINNPPKYKISNLIKPTIYTTRKPQNNIPFDIYCINGKAQYIQMDMWDVSGNFTGGPACRALFDLNYNKIKCIYIYPRCKLSTIPDNLKTHKKFFQQKPKKLKQIIIDAEKVAKGLPYIMVAFYLFDNEDYILSYTRTDAPHIEIEPNFDVNMSMYPLKCDQKYKELTISMSKEIDATFNHLHSNKVKHIQNDVKQIDGDTTHYHSIKLKNLNRMNDPKFQDIINKYLRSEKFMNFEKPYTSNDTIPIGFGSNNNLLSEEIDDFFNKDPKSLLSTYPKYKIVLNRYLLKGFCKKYGIPTIPVHKVYTLEEIDNLKITDLPNTGYRMFNGANSNYQVSSSFIDDNGYIYSWIDKYNEFRSLQEVGILAEYKRQLREWYYNPSGSKNTQNYCKICKYLKSILYTTIQIKPQKRDFSHFSNFLYKTFYMYNGKFGFAVSYIFGSNPYRVQCQTLYDINHNIMSCRYNYKGCIQSDLNEDQGVKNPILKSKKWNSIKNKPKQWDNMVDAARLIAKGLPFIRVVMYLYYNDDDSWIVAYTDNMSGKPKDVNIDTSRYDGFNTLECHDKYYKMWKSSSKTKEKFEHQVSKYSLCNPGEYVGII